VSDPPNRISTAGDTKRGHQAEDRERQPSAVPDAEAELRQKNAKLRRARNALQRELDQKIDELSQLSQELAETRQSLLQAQDELAAELAATRRVHELSTRLATIELQPLLEDVLDASIAIVGADFGNVQLYDPAGGALKIVAQRGFRQDFLDYFDNVHEGTANCGAALERRERVIVEDVLTDALFAPHLHIVTVAGYRAVQSTPLIGRGGEQLGMISTHFRRPHRPSERELRFVDFYAGQAAELIQRKRADETLRKSEERFRRYFELGLIGMAMTSPTKGILEVNDELCRILGYERDELLQKTWAEMTHPEDLAADVAEFDRVMAGEIDGYSLEKRWIRKDGRIIHGIMAAQCMRRADGSVDYFVGLVQDMTERKRAADNLRRSEAHLAEAQRLTHTGSWTWSVSSEEMFCSDELLRIFGQDAAGENPRHEDFLQMIHPEDQFRVRQAFDHAVGTGTDYEAEYRIVRRNGSIGYIQNLAHPVFDDRGYLVEYVGTAMDVTERKKAEQSVRQAHEQVDIIVNSISDQFFGLSRDWRFTYFNPRAERQMRLLGKDPADLIGKVLWDEFPEVPNEAALRRVMTERVPITDELYYAPLGEWVENYMYPSPDGGLVTFQRYITARKRMEEDLRKAHADLADVTRATMMGELAASIAHEINGPLGAIVNNGNACLQLIDAGPEALDEAREALSDIVDDAERAGAIIGRIRALVQRSLTERSLLQLGEAVTQALVFARGELLGRRIAARVELSDDLPLVSGDRVQLQQAFLNLILNAVDAMSAVEEDRRVLVIRGRRDRLDNKPAVSISVEDQGDGLPNDAERLFDAFFTTRSQGMGLGLRISRSIAEAHGGRLWATANEVHGATFHLLLPAAD
jgi:PAS domain S-box-containing protein